MNDLKSKNEINPLVERIIDELDFRTLPEEELEDFRNNMEMQISRRLGLIILENLGENGLKEYEKIASEELLVDSNELQDLIKKYIPDFEEKVRLGMEEFFNEVIKGASK